MSKVKNEWGTCPKCGSNDYEVRDWDLDGEYVSHKLCCNKCGHKWTEYQALVYDGYSDKTGEYNAAGECTETYDYVEDDDEDEVDDEESTDTDEDKDPLHKRWEKQWNDILASLGEDGE